MVYPEGIDDYTDEHNGDWGHYDSWNAGVHTEDVCDIAGGYGMKMCYNSCKQLNLCNACNWYTCYDDIYFVNQLIKQLKHDYQITDPETDKNAVIALIGASNGGMFTYYTAGRITEIKITHLIPVYGDAPKNSVIYPQKGQHLLSFYDFFDQVVPIDGSVGGGYFYESEKFMLDLWSNENKCFTSEDKLSQINMNQTQHNYGVGLKVTGFPHTQDDENVVIRDRNLQCYEYETCETGTKVTWCHYIGIHSREPWKINEQHLWWLFEHTQETESGTSRFLGSVFVILGISFYIIN